MSLPSKHFQIIFSLFKLASIPSFSSAVLRPPLRPYRLPEALTGPVGSQEDRALWAAAATDAPGVCWPSRAATSRLDYGTCPQGTM